MAWRLELRNDFLLQKYRRTVERGMIILYKSNSAKVARSYTDILLYVLMLQERPMFVQTI